ncbi:MAG: crosslink repair DNA glycosylase YcaQ family protein, partial [Anaerolineae bacterium]|nr:crosslink repair DNA glycosylase YcaQ family protein [Anaerolineae bacterium]
MSEIVITPQTARRLAVTKQRLTGPRPSPSKDSIMQVFRDLGCVQIDPIRAVERTQFLVLWSRLGNYDWANLDTLLWEERTLFEYWAHAASIVLTEDYPIHQAWMRKCATGSSPGEQRVRTWLTENEEFRQHILSRLKSEGPLSIQEIDDLSVKPWKSTGWTNDRNVDRMIGFMWEQGDVVVAQRDGLKKKWALTEDHLPAWTPREQWSEAEVVRRAAQRSLRALGVGTRKQIANHFTRDRYPGLAAALADLVAEGRIRPVIIREGDQVWPGEWYVHSDDVPLLEALAAGRSWSPRTVLLSPFDNLICDRDRTEQMWNFFFRIEIYVPKAKR